MACHYRISGSPKSIIPREGAMVVCLENRSLDVDPGPGFGSMVENGRR